MSIAGNLYVHIGDEKVDVGLCVKHGAKGMCVPDYVQAQPDNNGWSYSQALIAVIEQYKVSLAAVNTDDFIARNCVCQTMAILLGSSSCH